MRYNGTHGAQLDTCDRTHCVIISERLGISLDDVAGALHMTIDRLANLKTSRTAVGTGGLTIPIKQTFRRFAGQKFTKRQQESNLRSSGMNQVFYANQLIDMIEAKLLDMEDERLIERLRVLHDLLDGVLTAN